jgi:hypothetical protein
MFRMGAQEVAAAVGLGVEVTPRAPTNSSVHASQASCGFGCWHGLVPASQSIHSPLRAPEPFAPPTDSRRMLGTSCRWLGLGDAIGLTKIPSGSSW